MNYSALVTSLAQASSRRGERHPAVRGEIAAAYLALAAGQRARAQAFFEAAVKRLEELPSTDDLWVPVTALAVALKDKGPAFEASARRLIASRCMPPVAAVANLLRHFLDQGRTELARRAVEAFGASSKLSAASDIDALACRLAMLRAVADVPGHRGREELIGSCRRFVESADSGGPEAAPLRTQVRMALGDADAADGDKDAALQHYDLSLEEITAHAPSALTPALLIKLAKGYSAIDREEKAAECHELRRQACLELGRPREATAALDALGASLLKLGRVAEAAAAYGRYLSEIESDRSFGESSIVRARYLAARAASRNGDADRARNLYRLVVEACADGNPGSVSLGISSAIALANAPWSDTGRAVTAPLAKMLHECSANLLSIYLPQSLAVAEAALRKEEQAGREILDVLHSRAEDLRAHNGSDVMAMLRDKQLEGTKNEFPAKHMGDGRSGGWAPRPASATGPEG
jgi:tetratricopeptide (TPR) repeat protein